VREKLPGVNDRRKKEKRIPRGAREREREIERERSSLTSGLMK